MKGLFRKGILILAACSSLLMGNVAFAADAESDCEEPAVFADRIGGGFEKGVPYKKSCSAFLKKHDPLFMTATQYLVTREQLSEDADFLTGLGFDVEYNLENYEDYLEIPAIMSNVRDIIMWFSIFLLPTLSLVVLKQEKSKLSVMVLGLTLGAVFTVLQVASNPLRPAAYLVANLNLYGWNSNDVERGLEYLSIGSVDKFGEEFETQDTMLAEGVLRNAINERMTSLILLKEGYGSNKDVEIDMGRDEGNPSVAAWLENFRHCVEANHVNVDYSREWNISWTSISSANIPEKVSFMRTGQPKKYDCDPDYYGYEKPYMTITSSIENIIINFHQENFDAPINKDATMGDELATLFEESVGRANEEIEAANNKALFLSSSINGDLEDLYTIVVAADAANKDVEKYGGYLDFVNAKQGQIKDIFEFSAEGAEAMEVSERTHLNAIKLAELKRGIIAGYSNEDRKHISEAKYGYDYMKDFLDKAIVSELDYICAIEDGGRYKYRQAHASAWNAMDKTQKNKGISLPDGTKGISGDHPMHCFSGYFQGNGLTIKALGDPEKKAELKEKSEQMTRALKLYFRSLSEAAYNITMTNDSAYEDMKVEYLNSLDVDLKSSIDSRYIFLDQKEKMQNIFSSVKNAFTVNFADEDMVDPSAPNDYFFYGQFTEENVDDKFIDKERDGRQIRAFDFSSILNTPKGTGKPQADSGALSTSWDEELASLIPFEFTSHSCPVLIEGKCMASISELNHVNKTNVQEMFFLTLGGRLVITGAAGVCDVYNGAIDEVAGNAAGAKTAVKTAMKGLGIVGTVGCGLVSILDSTVGAILTVIVALYALLWFFMSLMEAMPILVMLFLYFHVFINFILPVLLLPLLIFLDLAHGMIKYIMTGFEDERSMIEMERTWSAIKGIFFKTISLFITLTVMLYLYTSPSIGHLIDSLMSTLFTKGSATAESSSSFISILISMLIWLTEGMIRNAAIVFTGLKVYRICEVVENQIMQSFNVKTEGSLFNESNATIGILSGMFTMKLHGEVKNFNKTLRMKTQANSSKTFSMLRENRQKKIENDLAEKKKNAEEAKKANYGKEEPKEQDTQGDSED